MLVYAHGASMLSAHLTDLQVRALDSDWEQGGQPNFLKNLATARAKGRLDSDSMAAAVLQTTAQNLSVDSTCARR